MATRNLTNVFLLMRNNAMQNRHIFSDQSYDDRTALVSTSSEVGRYHSGERERPTLPPDWVDIIEEVQRIVQAIKKEMKSLSSMHTAHLNRPTLDDDKQEERRIETKTTAMTRMFHEAQSLVARIQRNTQRASPQQQKLASNVTSSLARELQEHSSTFRQSQTHYLDKVKARESKSTSVFSAASQYGDSQSPADDGMDEIELLDQAFTRQKSAQITAENSQLVEQREQEIKNITQSINDLNTIFKDLAAMIVDQGTVLDRIDYNVEQTVVNVEEGHKQLVKAEKHHKKNRKMMIIIVLAGVVGLMLIILIAIKS